MNDDLEFVRARVPGYAAYADEAARHDSDMRVRAFLGERLAAVRLRLGPLEAHLDDDLETVLLRCAFTDQVFVKKFEHGDLGAALEAGLVRADRSALELGERLESCSATELPALMSAIGAQLDYRRSPTPVSAG